MTPPGKSTFQAHVARIRTPADARAVRRRLLEIGKIARATHNIWAYRLVDAATGARRWAAR